MRHKSDCCSGNGYVHFPAELSHATVKTLVLSRNLLNLAAHQQSVAPVVNPIFRVEVSFVRFVDVAGICQCCWDCNVVGTPEAHCLVLHCVTVVQGLCTCAAPFFGAV